MGRFSKLETHAAPAEPAAARPAASKRAAAESLGLEIRNDEEIAPDFEGAMRRGDEALFAGEPKDALRWFSRAMQLDPSRPDAWIAQIRVLILEGDLGDAKIWIHKALSIFPDAPALAALRAVYSARGGMIRQAIAASDLALSQRPEDSGAWVSRAHVLEIAGNKNAEYCFAQAFKLSNDADWQTPFLIGMILDSERRFSRSLRFYKAALGRRATLPYAWYRIAMAQAELGNRGAARHALAQAEGLCGENDRLRMRIVNAEIDRSLWGTIKGTLKRIFS